MVLNCCFRNIEINRFYEFSRLLLPFWVKLKGQYDFFQMLRVIWTIMSSYNEKQIFVGLSVIDLTSGSIDPPVVDRTSATLITGGSGNVRHM